MQNPPPELNVLGTIEIESPCPVPWNGMNGSDTVRFCSQCQRSVFDLAEMTTAESARLLGDTSRTPCVRLYRRRDGRVLSADASAGIRVKIWQRLRRHASWAASIIAFLLIPGCQTQGFVVRTVKSTTAATADGNAPIPDKPAIPDKPQTPVSDWGRPQPKPVPGQ